MITLMHKKHLAKFNIHLFKKKKRNRKTGIEETSSKSVYQENHAVSTTERKRYGPEQSEGALGLHPTQRCAGSSGQYGDAGKA